MKKLRCPGLRDFMIIFFHFTDIAAKEDEIRNIMHDFRKGIKIIQIDNMTHLESLYEELLISSEEFNNLINSNESNIEKYNDSHELFKNRYNLIKEFINLYY